MTRAEYIEHLSKALYGFDDESRKDIILEMDDHIDELIAQHPEKTEAQIVAELESPENLGRSLRQEAGIADAGNSAGADAETGADGGKDESEARRTGSGSEGGEWSEGGRRRRERITIDGLDLEDVIKRAFDIARLFKSNREFGFDKNAGRGDSRSEESSKDRYEKDEPRLRMEDIPVEHIRELVVKVRSADVKLLLSMEGLAIEASGKAADSLAIQQKGDDTLEIATAPMLKDLEWLTLKVPSSIDRVQIFTASGDVDVLDRIGDLVVQTASGSVDVKACSGDLRVTTASGDVSAKHCNEELKLATASGDIVLALDEQCTVAVCTTASGDVEIRYPEDFDGDFSWTTLSGDVDCDAEPKGSRRARTGIGSTPVKATTVSGDIVIRRR